MFKEVWTWGVLLVGQIGNLPYLVELLMQAARLMSETITEWRFTMKRKWTFVLIGVLVVVAMMCGVSASLFMLPTGYGGESSRDYYSEPSTMPAPPPIAPAEAKSGYGQADSAQTQPAGAVKPAQPTMSPASTGNVAVADRMIIRNANLSLTVKDAEASLETVKGIASQVGGFVSSSQTTRINKDQVRVSVTIRVPADKFDDVMRQLKQGVIRVNSERLSGQDVTEEYADINARLRNLEAVEKELLALLTTVREKSNRAEDILAVQRELNNVRMQIDQLKGRIQFLERSVALATITLDLIPDTLEAPVAPDTWDPLRVARDAVRALVSTLQGLGSIAIYLIIYILPVALIILVPIWVVVRWWRRGRRAKASA
jgi:hypothetical protein